MFWDYEILSMSLVILFNLILIGSSFSRYTATIPLKYLGVGSIILTECNLQLKPASTKCKS